MAGTEQSLLDPESATLSPLPDVLRQGLTGVAVLACLSFAASTLTLLYLTYKLIRWHLKTWRAARRAKTLATRPSVDLNLGLAEQHFGGQDHAGDMAVRKKSPNQFLILIYNLLIADIHQAMAFLINAVWVSNDAILVGTPTCWAQGWFVSTGDLASSCFILLIAIHTYMTVVWQYKPPQWALYLSVGIAWTFNYTMAVVGIGVTSNGRSFGGFYVRAAAWCWMNIKYENLRLVTHYLFIFIALAVTSVLYTLIFFSLKRGDQQAATPTSIPRSKPNTSIELHGRPAAAAEGRNTSPWPAAKNTAKVNAHSGGRHPAFLLYPIIYVVCTAPLALGRIATMAGVKVPLSYFCVAGALITSNGWLDVLLWGCTRGELLFTAEVDAEDVGIETFAFMRTPHGRKFGNMVWVEGGGSGGPLEDADRDDHQRRGLGGWLQERTGWRRLGRSGRGSGGAGRGRASGQARSISQESLRGAAGRSDMAIQMDLVTTVVVEVDPDKLPERDPRSRYRHPSETSLSLHSAEKDIDPSRM